MWRELPHLQARGIPTNLPARLSAPTTSHIGESSSARACSDYRRSPAAADLTIGAHRPTLLLNISTADRYMRLVPLRFMSCIDSPTPSGKKHISVANTWLSHRWDAGRSGVPPLPEGSGGTALAISDYFTRRRVATSAAPIRSIAPATAARLRESAPVHASLPAEAGGWVDG